MQQQTYIRAIYTPEKHNEEKGKHPDPDKAESVTIVAFNDSGGVAIFIDEQRRLRREYLHLFSDCVFITL